MISLTVFLLVAAFVVFALGSGVGWYGRNYWNGSVSLGLALWTLAIILGGKG